MAVVQDANEFLTVLRKSRLLTRDQYVDAVEKHGLEDMMSPEDIVQLLQSRELLTDFQAKRLLAGKHRGLFIDDYRILEILGSGGMGYLYSALDPNNGFQVAIKVLSDRYRHDKGMISRFHLEAEAGLRLNHPNILRTKAIRRTEDIYGTIHYMVMELIKGVSLYEALSIRRRALPWRQACDVIYQAAKGLQHAHDQGLVHRDVKPENLLMRNDGTVKVLDFGLAMINNSEAELSMATILGQNCLGTADYISPEQSIDSFEVDCRSDIYSLGCTFYFLLTGRCPFPYKEVAKKLQGHRSGRAKPVHELRSRVPERVSKIIQKMMAKRPENRFQTCDELCLYLERIKKRESVDFDFDAVLEKRARIAEKRLAAESKLRNESRVSSVSTLDIGKSAIHKRPNIDTAIQKDTRVDQS